MIKNPKAVVQNRLILYLKILYLKLIPQNQQLTEELHKPIIRKFEKGNVYSAFKDNIWAADLADMQLLSRYNKGIRFLLCVIDIFSK